MKAICADCGRPFVISQATRCTACRRLRRAGRNNAGETSSERRCRACGQGEIAPGANRCARCRRERRPAVARFMTAEEREAVCYLVVGMRPPQRRVWFGVAR
ncbi:MAG TPA: hypothetical protein VGA50_04830 [Kiloniellales bacterium]